MIVGIKMYLLTCPKISENKSVTLCYNEFQVIFVALSYKQLLKTLSFDKCIFLEIDFLKKKFRRILNLLRQRKKCINTNMTFSKTSYMKEECEFFLRVDTKENIERLHISSSSNKCTS